MIGAGFHSIRFLPPLDVTKREIGTILQIVKIGQIGIHNKVYNFGIYQNLKI